MKNQVIEGDPDIYYYRQGSAFSNIDTNLIDQINLNDFDQLHITGIPLALSSKTRETSLRLVKKAREAGLYISFDPNLRPSLWPNQTTMIDTTNEMAKYCNMFLPGNNEGKILMGSDDPEKIAVYYHQLGCDELVIKLGNTTRIVKIFSRVFSCRTNNNCHFKREFSTRWSSNQTFSMSSRNDASCS